MTRHLLPITALAVALMVPHHAITAAKPSSNVVDLGHLGGGFSDAFGINNDPSSVQVVGRSTRADGFTHAFFWTALRADGRSPHVRPQQLRLGHQQSRSDRRQQRGCIETGVGCGLDTLRQHMDHREPWVPRQAPAAPRRTVSTTEPPALRQRLPSLAPARSTPAPPTPRCGRCRQVDGPCRRSARCQMTLSAWPMM